MVETGRRARQKPMIGLPVSSLASPLLGRQVGRLGSGGGEDSCTFMYGHTVTRVGLLIGCCLASARNEAHIPIAGRCCLANSCVGCIWVWVKIKPPGDHRF